MYTLKQTEKFRKWLQKTKDLRAKEAILRRLTQLRIGHWGDYASLGEGVFELRIHLGAGYRIYYWHENQTVVVLLCGGNKSTQARDIKAAKVFVTHFKNQEKDS